MRNMMWKSTVALAFMALCLAGSANAAEKEKGGGRRGGLTPETIEAALTGDLALSAEQKTAVTAAYDKTVKPVREKFAAAADKDARKALFPEMKTANENFRNELKTILKEPQMAKITAMTESMRKDGPPKKDN